MHLITTLILIPIVLFAAFLTVVAVWTGGLILLLLSWDDPAGFRRLERRWLRWISRAFLAAGSLMAVVGTVVSLLALHTPALMRLLDPVFDGVVNGSLGLGPVCKIGVVICLAGGALTWCEYRAARMPHRRRLRSGQS